MIILVRHGESETNKFIHDDIADKDTAINAIGDPHLTALGKIQAKETGDFLAKTLNGKKVIVNTSPFTRTLETCTHFCKIYGDNFIDFHKNTELLEWTPLRKKLTQTHIEQGLKHDVSWDVFESRVKNYAKSIEDGIDRVVFGHSLFFTALTAHLASQREWFPKEDQMCFEIPNCSITVLEKKQNRWTVHHVSSIAHLSPSSVSGIHSNFGYK
jgi:broad specificity phosphatase PhoE